jgi:ubiquinone/menaquinone biosynthesis C-methylase UbiE
MPFESGMFGHLLCYDTVHHMHDYPKVFAEFFRVLRPGGRGVFVEPGAAIAPRPKPSPLSRPKRNMTQLGSRGT